MDLERVQKTIVNVIANQTNRDPSDIDRETVLDELAGFDAIDAIQVISRLENLFLTRFDDTDAEEWQTVGHIIDYVYKQIQEDSKRCMAIE